MTSRSDGDVLDLVHETLGDGRGLRALCAPSVSRTSGETVAEECRSPLTESAVGVRLSLLATLSGLRGDLLSGSDVQGSSHDVPAAIAPQRVLGVKR